MSCCHQRRKLLAGIAALPAIAMAGNAELLTGNAAVIRQKKRLKISVTKNDTLIRIGQDAQLAQAGAELELDVSDSIVRAVVKTGRVLSVFRPDSQERIIENNGVTAGFEAPPYTPTRCMGKPTFVFATALLTMTIKG